MAKSLPFKMEFHVSRKARDRYQFDETLFSFSGNVIFANIRAARLFAQQMNAQRDLLSFPEQAIRAGQLNAMGLIDEILHLVVSLYRQQVGPDVMGGGLTFLQERLGKEKLDAALRRFLEEFPPVAVYRREMDLDTYLQETSILPDGRQVPNREIVLEELLMLWLANANPAFDPYQELFDDTPLEKETSYRQIVSILHDYFDLQPSFGPDNQNLVDMLRSPAITVPHSLSGQLEYIRQRWGSLLGKYLFRLLSSLDLIKEEEKAIFGVGGGGIARVYDFTGQELEVERFSQDKEWMPRLVLIAKNIYVWLDQLSKKYRRSITTLDQIPDEELDRLASWGFTGLWMIGLWERSQASKRIKQIRGNPDAVASAYSLYDYRIAGDLGGDSAYDNLRQRAWRRGLRLASDMVPNHMGIDSLWVIEHPDWFIGLEYSPFPSYTFDGPNLSWDDRVGLYIEDHYYNNTDAAVVFKRVDHQNGTSRYIYHGNDGTSMPWNDTAQLNYLMPQVREAVIQTILSVARKFPVIRFDAAMTLAKKHYQRLWYPEPGTGGAIPSRAEFGLTREQFDALFPEEFWREVVDRVAQEVPDTLLLAEAFWLMEGYFVRTLGMHRVYNSAFMNMLRDEKNAEYRLVIKNTLEFDPEILKRYVNFMNNPDERTSVDQFGKGDKYFGVCTLMSTMPGLPMFGHGQIEGYTEKYGMEFRRAYWDESPDPDLVQRHEREIFPLLRKRYLFAEVKDFLLYDFYSPQGYVNEDVFAYSNRSGNERSLVVYHNKYATAQGWIRTSAAYSVKGPGGERSLEQKSLAQGLGLQDNPDAYSIFRDHINGLEFIRSNRELFENGLYIELEAYKFNVFLDFREVIDDEWRRYSQLAAYLNGRGVPNIDEAMKEIFLQPIHYPFRELVNAGMYRWLLDNRAGSNAPTPETAVNALDEAERKELALLMEIQRATQGIGNPVDIAAQVRSLLAAALRMPGMKRLASPEQPDDLVEMADYLVLRLGDNPLIWGSLFSWLFVHKLGNVVYPQPSDAEAAADTSRSWIDEWLLGKIMAQSLQDFGLEEGDAWRSVALVKILTLHSPWLQAKVAQPQEPLAVGEAQGKVQQANQPTGLDAYQVLQDWLRDGEVQSNVGVNRYQGVLWYNKESFDNLLWWIFAVSAIELTAGEEELSEETKSALLARFELVRKIQQAEERSDFQVDRLLQFSK